MKLYRYAFVLLLSMFSLAQAADDVTDNAVQTISADPNVPLPKKVKKAKPVVERVPLTDAEKQEAIAKAKALYTCYFYFNAGAGSKDLALKDKSKELSGLLLLKASVLAVNAGGEESAKSLAREGAADFKSFLASTQMISSDVERNQRLQEFTSNCSAVGRIPIDISNQVSQVVPNSSERLSKARALYACFAFFNEGSRSAEGDQKVKLRRISTQFLTKATQEVVAVDADKDPGNQELAKRVGNQGDGDLKDFLTSVQSLPTEAERNAKISGFANNCASLIGIAK